MREKIEYMKVSSEELEEIVEKLFEKMQYTIEARDEEEKQVFIKAKEDNIFGEVKFLIQIDKTKRKGGVKSLQRLIEHMEKENVGRGVYINLSGFTKSLLKEARKFNVKLVDKTEFLQLMKKHGVEVKEEKREVILSRVFASSTTPQNARIFFENSRSHKLFGIFGSEEKIRDVKYGYAPIGSFEVEHHLTLTSKSLFGSKQHTIKEKNIFHVNLATAEIIYLASTSSSTPKIRSTLILKELLNLPSTATEIFADLLNEGPLDFNHLNQRHFLFIEESYNDFLMLLSKKLIAPLSGINPRYIANVDLPPFSSPCFNISSHLKILESQPVEVNPDRVAYTPRKIAHLLASLFKGNATFREVIYLPYYSCIYIDEKKRLRSEFLYPVEWG